MTSILIDSAKDFKNLCNRIKKSPYVALDTEFIRNKTYWAELCLLQVADKDNNNVAVVDCLAKGMDLSPLEEILRDKSIIKIMHAARQDVEIFYKEFGFVPLPLFDTQIASMACGLGYQIGYDNLIKKTIGVEIDKSSQYKDWRKRPLSKSDISYASGDVLYLTKAYEWLDEFLTKHERHDWIKAEMEKITNEQIYKMDPKRAWLRLKMKGNNTYRSILRELSTLRELEAQARNVPRSFVFKDDILYGIASASPRNYDALKEAANLYGKNYKGEICNKILLAIKKGIESAHTIDESEIVTKRNGNPAVLEMLKMLLKITSVEYNVSSSLITDSDELAQISWGDFDSCRVMQGWRHKVFGKRAKQLLNGELSLSLKSGKPQFNDIEQS